MIIIVIIIVNIDSARRAAEIGKCIELDVRLGRKGKNTYRSTGQCAVELIAKPKDKNKNKKKTQTKLKRFEE